MTALNVKVTSYTGTFKRRCFCSVKLACIIKCIIGIQVVDSEDAVCLHILSSTWNASEDVGNFNSLSLCLCGLVRIPVRNAIVRAVLSPFGFSDTSSFLVYLWGCETTHDLLETLENIFHDLIFVKEAIFIWCSSTDFQQIIMILHQCVPP